MHHFTLGSLDDLAIVFKCQRNSDTAEEQTRRALGGLANVLGHRHRRTFASTKYFVLILRLKARYNGAESSFTTSLQAQERDFRRGPPKQKRLWRELG